MIIKRRKFLEIAGLTALGFATTRFNGFVRAADDVVRVGHLMPGFEFIDDAIANWVATRQFRNFGFAMYSGNSPLLARSYSIPALTSEITTENTSYNLWSVSKLVTLGAVFLAQQKNLLNIELPAVNYLPSAFDLTTYPERAKIRVRDLIQMRSGLPEWGGSGTENSTPSEMLKVLRDRPSTADDAPGFRYRNSNYLMLASIVEAVTGTPYLTWVQNNIFTPLGITQFRDEGVWTALSGEPTYYGSDGNVHSAGDYPFDMGAGNYVASAPAVALFGAALGSNYVQPVWELQTVEAIETLLSTRQDYPGWMEWGGVSYWGAKTRLTIHREANLSVAMLSNTGTWGGDDALVYPSYQTVADAPDAFVNSGNPVSAIFGNQNPNSGHFTLTSGFLPDPFTVRVAAGGAFAANVVADTTECVGYVTQQPDVQLIIRPTRANTVLHIYYIPDRSSVDTTLMIYSTESGFQCGDDFEDTRLPFIVFTTNRRDGFTLNIWAGVYNQGEPVRGTLYVSERPNASPSRPNG